jgi:transcriptional regulator with XRE-family HTH domain
MKEAREKAGVESKEELARISGVSAPTIFRIESGKTKNPGIDTLKALCTALNLNYEDTLRRAGYLPESLPVEDLQGYVGAVEDFNSGLTPEEVQQMKKYKQFLISQRNEKTR